MLGQILRAQSASGDTGRVFFFRDAQGLEVDFVIERGDSLRLIEVRWSESAIDTRSIASLRKVQALLGARAAVEHWVATRTERPRAIAAAPSVRLIDASHFEEWFEPPRAPPARRRS